MRFRDRFQRSHHGYGPVALSLVIPLLTLIVPLFALITGVRRRRPNVEGVSVSDFGWPDMLVVWLILMTLVYLVYIPFLAPARERRRRRRLARHRSDEET